MTILNFEKHYYLQSRIGGSAYTYAQYMTRATDRWEYREDLLEQGQRNMPAWAAWDPTQLFAAAERYERLNGRTAEAWCLTLPRELELDDQLALTDDFVQLISSERLPTLWVMHDNQASDGGGNPHAHVLMSARIQDGIDRPPAQFFTRYNPQHPERGGCKKDLLFSTKMGKIRSQREVWADLCNWYLEQGGSSERVTAASLLDRGIGRKPAYIAGRRVPRDLEPELHARREERLATLPAEQAQTQAMWEQRREERGYSRSHARFLRQVQYELSREWEREREITPEEIEAQERQVQMLHAEVMAEEWRVEHQRERSPATTRRIEALLQDTHDETRERQRERTRDRERGWHD